MDGRWWERAGRSVRRGFAARVHEGFVDDPPRAIDPIEGEEVDERYGAPISVLGDNRVRGVTDLMHRQDPSAVVAGVSRCRCRDLEEPGDRHVVARAGEFAVHP